MTWQMIVSSMQAFHANAINSLVYNFTQNWCLILLVVAAAISVVLSVKEESASVIRDEQNVL